VVKEGQVVESGTHEELLGNTGGIYSQLVRRQLQGEKKAGGAYMNNVHSQEDINEGTGGTKKQQQ
ncbi:unnamed protein product, partial [Heterosigma akashiwo]